MTHDGFPTVEFAVLSMANPGTSGIHYSARIPPMRALIIHGCSVLGA